MDHISQKSHLKELDFQYLIANWKNKTNQCSAYLYVKFETCLKFCILGLNFVIWPIMSGEVSYIASCNILPVNNNPLENLPWSFLFCP